MVLLNKRCSSLLETAAFEENERKREEVMREPYVLMLQGSGAVSVALINQPSFVSWVREGIKASERHMHHLSESEGDKSGDKTLAHRMCGKRHVAKSFLASNQ